MDKTVSEELKKARKYCLRLFALRARSEREIAGRLEEKGYTPETRRLVVDLLRKEGLVDDLKFAGTWIENRMCYSPRSKDLIRSELEAKGIAPDITEKAFSERGAEIDDRRTAAKLVREKIGRGGMPRELKAKSRLFRFLLNRGFDRELAEEVIERETESERQDDIR